MIWPMSREEMQEHYDITRCARCGEWDGCICCRHRCHPDYCETCNDEEDADDDEEEDEDSEA